MALMKSKQIKWLVWAGAMVALFLVVATLLIAVLVPPYLESVLIPQMAHKYGLDASQVNIRRIGWMGAELGPVHLDGDKSPVVQIAAVHMDYSPLSLLSGDIKAITLAGVRIVVEATPEGLSIPGLKWPPKKSAGKTPATLPDLKTLLPVGVERIHLSQWEVVVLWKGRPVSIGMDISLACGGLSKGRITGNADLSILGSTLALSASLDQGDNRASIKMTKGELLLGALSRLMDLPPQIAVAATAELQGHTRFQLAPLELADLSLSGHLTETHITWSQGAIENLPSPDGAVHPIAITLEAPELDRITWQGGPFLIDAPVKAHILDLKGHWTPNQGEWVLNAAMKTLVPAQAVDTLTLIKALPMTWLAQARKESASAIAFDAHTTDTHPLSIEMAPIKISSPQYALSIEGRLVDRSLRATTTLNANQVGIGFPDGEAAVTEIKINSTLQLNATGTPSPSEIDAEVVLNGIRAKRESIRLMAPLMAITASGKSDPKTPWRYAANLKVTNARMTDPSNKLDLKKIEAELPLQWPPVSKAQAGKIRVKTILWDGRNLGDLSGRLRQDKSALALSLRHNSKLLPKLSVLINGRIDKTNGSIDMNLPAYRFPEAVDLGRFFPEGSGMLVEGQVEASAKLTLNNGKLSGHADFQASQGSLRDPERQLSLEGIHGGVHLDDLMALKSAPQQKLRVGHLQFGNLMATDLELDYQLEGQQTLFVERTRIQWCQGRLNAAAIRFAPGKKDYDVTLFCDRLNLAMVLEQLGAGQASGEGTVNGAIPLSWRDGHLSFHKGFLYSTPGKPGAIQLTGTEVLLAGLPPDTPQHTQVDIATEALKDYTYKWAKLNMESQGENLLLKLQFDGKPNRLMPFAFDKQLGRFKRVAGQGQADFTGISIDLNFNSPLDKILHYKKLLTPNR